MKLAPEGATASTELTIVQGAPVPRTANLALSRAAAALAGTIGLVVLLGWILDIGVLKSVIPGLGAMQRWTATGMVLGTLALGLASAAAPRVRAASALPALALVVAAACRSFSTPPATTSAPIPLLSPDTVLTTQSHSTGAPRSRGWSYRRVRPTTWLAGSPAR
jgi:hypothetical protein